jgi:glucose-6-phosphate isomerase
LKKEGLKNCFLREKKVENLKKKKRGENMRSFSMWMGLGGRFSNQFGPLNMK